MGASGGRSRCVILPQLAKCLIMRYLQEIEPYFGLFWVRQLDAPEAGLAGICGVREGRDELVM